MILAALLILAAQEGPALERPCMPSLPNATLKQSAFGKSWYLHAESIEIFDQTYVKYGLPRALRPGDVDYAANYMGVAVALDRQAVNRDVIYLLTNPDECEFQPFRLETPGDKKDGPG